MCVKWECWIFIVSVHEVMPSFTHFHSGILDTQVTKFHMQEDYKCTAYIFVSFLYKNSRECSECAFKLKKGL